MTENKFMDEVMKHRALVGYLVGLAVGNIAHLAHECPQTDRIILNQNPAVMEAIDTRGHTNKYFMTSQPNIYESYDSVKTRLEQESTQTLSNKLAELR